MADTDAQATTEVVARAPAPPTHGEPCEECGAPLAADQRYCLNCGRRRGGPRVDYRHYMAAAPVTGEQAAPPADRQPSVEEPARTQRDYAPLAAVGGIAILGLMLLVGVLIGKGNNDNTAATPAPVVIKGPSGESSGGEGAAASPKGTAGNAPSGGAKKAKQSGGGGGTGNAHKATTDELEEHSSASGESYEKQSEKLPNEIATPGKPPPIDTSKPPGGGEGEAEVIK